MVRCEFKKGGALALIAEDCEGALAVKYWYAENREHAGKLIEIDTSVMDGYKTEEELTIEEPTANPGPQHRRMR